MASPYGNPPPHRSGEPGPGSHDSGESSQAADRLPRRSEAEAGDRQEPTTPEVQQPVSAAQQRFLSCRWRKAAENGVPDHCGHRDVLPMAGATGFVPDAWCPDCQYFKAKRTPRKREEPDRDRDWRW